MKESETIEAFLRKAGAVVRFMWIAQSPLEITPEVVEKQIVEPLSRLLRDWNVA
jgi:phage-related protein